MIDITLQINLSAGDINYAHLTVPALVEHHKDIKNRLLIIDCCRPQRSTILNPDTKYPLETFEKKVEEIIKIGRELLANGIISELYLLKPDDLIIKQLSKKYLSGLYHSTHGAGGTGNMSYLAGIELPKTQYVLHYDGDMMLYQKDGYSWANEAISLLKECPEAIMAVPRLCPPAQNAEFDLPSLNEGRKVKSFNHFWLNDWFSTRQFLIDKNRFNTFLPLVQGKVMLELLLRKYLNRAFPLDPEILIMKSVGPRGGKRLILKNTDAWLLHPVNKQQLFLDILPAMLTAINEGKYPSEQSGIEDIDLAAWVDFLNNDY